MANDVKDYYLGLDIGTNSVGWAATDEEYNLCRFRKKDLWGIRLFESGNTAAERRLQRCARRRTDRKKQRIDLLQMLFAEEMAKVDETFFIRLNESRLHLEDKSCNVKFPLFADDDYTDIDYHKEYPTIFHLRKELIENPEPHDIRLVYLALHHIIKNRGHFLIDGDLKAAREFGVAFQKVLEDMNGDAFPFSVEVSADGIEEAKEILQGTQANSTKAKAMESIFHYGTQDLDKEELKNRKACITNICKLYVGNKGDIKKIFYQTDLEELETTSFTFGDEAFTEKILPDLEALYPDQTRILEDFKMIYDWGKLSEILEDEEYISSAKVKQYEKHKNNLGALRKLILKYFDKKIYNDFFNSENAKTAYSNYIGEVKKNGKTYAVTKCTEEDFYKNLKKLMDSIEPEDEADAETIAYMKSEIERQSLLPIQRSKANASVPRQVHEAELNAILTNAEKYLPFLQETDESGLSISEKARSIFRFRVPYYVGPLSTRHQAEGANQWMVRREGQENARIYPWNFSQIVDVEKSNEKFIRRMTNKCTYLVGEDVLPKNSLLYSRYMVLNELNNLRIRGHKIPVELKQEIYNELFRTKNKVTGKALLQYLQKDDPDLKKEDLSGFDGDFKTQLKSYMDFKKQVFGERIEDERVQKIVEDIIRWSTIYDKDSKMIKNILKSVYPEALTEDEIKACLKLHYSGWGNFSQMFLNGIEGVKKETGEVFTIIGALWETNDNLMQILSGDYTFMEQIRAFNNEKQNEITEVSYDALVKDLYVSPAVKRAIWQTIQITEEIRKVQKGAPKKIFVEMARGEETKETGKKGTRTVSRKDRLLELYKNCESDTRDWIQEIENRDEREFNSIKLYLYYTQMGKDMYTGAPIDINQLMNGNSNWDRDHIYPQSKIKDDSLDNLVLVNKKDNIGKSNGALSPEIQKRMKTFWGKLRKLGLISETKYERLTRAGEFTDEELSGFIARQLVETRQSTKVIADLLKRIYPDSQVVYVKARLASNFRHDDLKMLKSRRVNDYHHAKDAYLNVVVGNVYNSIFTSDPKSWYRKHEDEAREYNIKKIFRREVVRDGKVIWKKPTLDENDHYVRNEDGGLTGGSIDTVRKTMLQNNILYTEYTYCETGQLYDLTLYKKGDSSITIPIKAGLPIEKYGGYKSAKTSYFAVIEYDGKKGERKRMILGVPIYIANILNQNPNAFDEYCENVKELKNVKVLHEKIKKNSLISVDGFPMRIRGETGSSLSVKSNLQLNVTHLQEVLIRKIEKYVSKNPSFEVDSEREGFDDESLNKLYEILLDKLKGPYKKRPANQDKQLESGKAMFENELSLREKAHLINEIITLLRCDNETKADLRNIGGTQNSGYMRTSREIKKNMKLINQSVTGIFKNTEEL